MNASSDGGENENPHRLFAHKYNLPTLSSNRSLAKQVSDRSVKVNVQYFDVAASSFPLFIPQCPE